MSDEVLITVQTAPMRRALALTIIGTLGVLLVYLGATLNGSFLGRIFLIVLGTFCLWGGYQLYLATARALELTRDVLRDSAGDVVAQVQDIAKVDRGTFAFKPSNGFILVLTSKQDGAWRPGLWWRLNKRVGIGGVTNAGQNKAMAEILSVLVAERHQ